MDVSSTEKNNTKEDLARVMTKSRSETQEKLVSSKCPNVGDLIE